MMSVAESRCGTARRPIQALLGWIFAAFIVSVAFFGPPLTGQRIPALLELRHDVLMIDREFERSSIPTNTLPCEPALFCLLASRRDQGARDREYRFAEASHAG
jgi:hypothetical protein